MTAKPRPPFSDCIDDELSVSGGGQCRTRNDGPGFGRRPPSEHADAPRSPEFVEGRSRNALGAIPRGDFLQVRSVTLLKTPVASVRLADVVITIR